MKFRTAKQSYLRVLLAGILVLLVGLSAGCNTVGNQKIYAHQVFTEGLAYESLSNYSRALELYREVVDQYSETNQSMAARAQIRMARIYKNDLNNDSAALQAFQAYVERYPEEPDHQEVVLELARMYEETGNINQSIETFKTFVDRYGSSPYQQEALYKMGVLHLKDSNYQSAVKRLNQVINNFPDGDLTDEALIKRAQAYEALDQPDDEIASYELLVERFPDNEQAEYAILQIVKIASSLNRTSTVNKWVKRYRSTYPNGEFLSKINVLDPSENEVNNDEG